MRKKQQSSGAPRTLEDCKLGDCEAGTVVRIELKVTGQLKGGALVRLCQEGLTGRGPWALPAEADVQFVSGPKHVKQGNQGDVDPVGGGR